MLRTHHQEHRGTMKYGFKIRTRGGMVVDNLTIPGRDQAEAERKLQQIYRYCEILEAKPVEHSGKEESMDMDGIISLISRQEKDG
jgi:hypothetical protein